MLNLHSCINTYWYSCFNPLSNERLEDLKVLKHSPDLLNDVKIGQGQLRLIIKTYFVLPYMGSDHFEQVT